MVVMPTMEESITPLSPPYRELLAAIADGREATLKSLVAGGLDLNVSLGDEPPPLFAAILAANRSVIDVLIDHGADVNFEPESPADCLYAPRPLDWAMQLRFLLDWDKYQPVAELLAGRGATDLDGFSELPDLDQVRERAREQQANRGITGR
jgi:hypothetical protein